MNGPIWSPEVYGDIAGKLFGAVGMAPSDLAPPSAQDDEFLSNLADLTARRIAQQDVSLSGALAGQFRDAALHEKAALLLGAFMLREHSGEFFDIRSPLCRMTAHLAFARGLAGTSAPNLNGNLAEALLFTLMNNQRDALQKLSALSEAPATAQPWVRALRTRNTSDYRILDKIATPTQLEKPSSFALDATRWIRISRGARLPSRIRSTLLIIIASSARVGSPWKPAMNCSRSVSLPKPPS